MFPSNPPLLTFFGLKQGWVDVLIKHPPNIGDMVSNKYLKVMFKIPKKVFNLDWVEG